MKRRSQARRSRATEGAAHLAERDLVLLLGEAEGVPLIRPYSENGPQVMCPVCETWRPFMEYVRLQVVQKYSRYLLPIWKCPGCHHLFVPNPDPE